MATGANKRERVLLCAPDSDLKNFLNKDKQMHRTVNMSSTLMTTKAQLLRIQNFKCVTIMPHPHSHT